MKNLLWKDNKTVDILSKIIAQEALFLGETDTIVGLFGPITQEAFLQLNKVKGRSTKPYLIIASSLTSIKTLVNDDDLQAYKKFLGAIWPGPVTVIVNAKPILPDFLVSKDKSIAIRIPKHTHLLTLLERTGPLFSTSANKTDQPSPEHWTKITPEILAYVHTIVYDEEIDKKPDLPSTIIDIRSGSLVLVRAGAYPHDQLTLLFNKLVFN
jgi:L-threonylcarbamoyladenylate synthase